MREHITVRVPACTGNMGSGFDCIGMALDIWNSVTVSIGSSGLNISGEGEKTLPRNESNLVHKSLSMAFQEHGMTVPELGIECKNEIPMQRGLGSSSAAILSGILAGNEACGKHLSQQRILEMAAAIEGHTDQVTPALLGGCQISLWEKDSLISSNVPIPEGLKVVIFIPDTHVSTKHARDILPKEVSLEDAVYNVSRAALLVMAFTSGDLTHLKVSTDDRLHQPAREVINPAMFKLFEAAQDAGALGVFLSGAGPSIVALTKDRELTIGSYMADAAIKSSLDGTIKVTRPTDYGAHVVNE